MSISPHKKTSIIKALQLRCPYCGLTPLLKEKAWLSFRNGCKSCNYSYEREEGYFTGASWLINFPVSALVTFVAGAFALAAWSISVDAIVLVLSVFALVLGFGLTPFSMAVWMVIEHRINPLNEKDCYLSTQEEL